MPRNPSVVVIGAGVSGIAAARSLIENGLTNVTVLEASNRIGGRIHSQDFLGSVVDLGAQWCHGEKGNVVFDLVKDLNLLDASFNTYQDNVYFNSDGKQIDGQIGDKLYKTFAEISYGIEDSSDIEESFGDCFIRRYNEHVLKEFGDKEFTSVASCMLDWFHKLTLCYTAAPTWLNVSVSQHDCYEECEGNPLLHWKDKGYQMLLKVLTNQYPNKAESPSICDKVIFNKDVETIHWNGEQEEVGQILIYCADGSHYKADHVIITASLGVLKERHKKLFVPELPLYKQNAIEALDIGTVNKIFLKFCSRWWPSDCPGFSLIWNKDDAANILNDFPYGPVLDGRSWLEDVFGFYVIDGDPKTLLGWVVGQHAPDVELLSDEIVLEGCMYLLNKFLADKYEIPRPDAILRSKWHSNPYFRGSYSYRSLKTDKRKSSAEELARPVSNSAGLRLLFAGEATHSRYYSTVHGAIESGFREADRIAKLYMNAGKKHKVAIVGAGMAGLGAACTLLKGGVKDVVILEALNEVGGRVKTVNINGSVIELGAQWLHGARNLLYKVAESNDLLLPEISYEGSGVYVRDDCFIFDDFLVKKVDFEIGQILEDCEKFVHCDAYPKSFGDYLEGRYSDLINESDEDDVVKEMKWQLYDWHVRFQLIDNSCKDLKNISAKDWGRYSCLGKNGQKYFNIKGGYKALIEVLVKPFHEGVLRLNTPVLNITYAENDVKLLCEDGSSVWAEHVIVTSSVGVLQQNVPQFRPELPNILSSAISSLGFHGIGKVFLLFGEKWWKTEGFQLIWRRDSFVSEERTWTRYITGFDLVLNQPNMLLAWVGGNGVEKMEQLADDVLGRHCIDLLRMFLKDKEIPYPLKVFR